MKTFAKLALFFSLLIPAFSFAEQKASVDTLRTALMLSHSETEEFLEALTSMSQEIRAKADQDPKVKEKLLKDLDDARLPSGNINIPLVFGKISAGAYNDYLPYLSERTKARLTKTLMKVNSRALSCFDKDKDAEICKMVRDLESIKREATDSSNTKKSSKPVR